MQLDANDINVCHCEFSINSKAMMVKLDFILYKQAKELSWEINTKECKMLSTARFLDNNEFNITACCLDMNFGLGNHWLFTVHASPCFWQFLFQKQLERTIQLINLFNLRKYSPTTFIRMAYKAYQMNFISHSTFITLM